MWDVDSGTYVREEAYGNSVQHFPLNFAKNLKLL